MVLKFLKSKSLALMVIGVVWVVSSCKSADKSGNSNLESYDAYMGVPGNKSLSIPTYTLRFEIVRPSYSHYAFMVCAYPTKGLVHFEKTVGCGNPFVLLDPRGAFKSYVQFNERQEDFMARAAEFLHKDAQRRKDRDRFLEKALVKIERIREDISSEHKALIFELRVPHRRLAEVSRGVTLKAIMSGGDHSFKYIYNNQDHSEKIFKEALGQLRQMVAKILSVDPSRVDYCYPVVKRVGDQRYVGSSLCSIAGAQGQLGVEYNKAKLPDSSW
ncbi:MAG: hypothetical protein OXC44_07290 [Proteobacteria bacterium]|nr:hypothetical protein [Pseudomonadota bacterium]